VEIGVGLMSAFAVIWGTIRTIGYGEQQPARGLLFFGAIVFVVCPASWLEGKDDA
jgi:hypothetical protein